MSLLFVLLQGALGALTVMFEGTLALNWVLSVHFGLSLIAFASVLLLTIRLFQVDREQQDRPEKTSSGIRRLQFPVWGLAVYTYIVVYTGALVEHTGAVTSCGYQIPGCGSTYFPSFTSLAGIQVLHRYAAGLLWLLVLWLLVAVVRHYRERRDIVRGTWWAFILISLQAVSGMINVLTAGQLLASLLHTTLISIFFSVLCFLCVQVGWPWKRNNLAQNIESKHLVKTLS
jgi:cytochrome c oxidase assembly protein subunit 15